MAKIQEEIYIVKLSRLVKTNEEDVAAIADNDFENNLQAILQEMVSNNIIIEVEKLEQ